jgi:hypothetical protein
MVFAVCGLAQMSFSFTIGASICKQCAAEVGGVKTAAIAKRAEQNMKRKRPKGSRRANLEIRIRQIANRAENCNGKGPVFLLVNGRIRRVTPQAYEAMLNEIDGLEYFSGESLPRPCRIG